MAKPPFSDDYVEMEKGFAQSEGGHGGFAETLEVDVERAEIQGALRESGELFIETMLGEELTSPVPLFHKEVWQLMTNTAVGRVLLAIPRDHAKTTLAKLAVVWYFRYTSHRFCAYVANTNSRAKDACRDIMGFIKSPNFKAIYGSPRIIKESETESIWIFEIPVDGGRVKKCILRAIGGNQSMRGINVDNQRPDIAVVDDLEDDDNTGSETLQKNLDRWVFGPFIKALARQKKIIWLGNMLAKTSLLARLSMNPKWNPVVFGCLVKDPDSNMIVPLWADRWSMEELIEDFNEYRDLGLMETWMCEMMNMPGHGQNGFSLSHMYMIEPPMPDETTAAWLILDPAFGEKETNDDSSITAHVIRDDGLPVVVEDVTGRFTEAELFDIMLRLARKWNAWAWGIEAVAAQKLLISMFNIFMNLKLVPNHIELIPLISGRGDPKISRIKAFIGLMGKKEYAIANTMLTFVTQAMEYNMTKKNNRDDLLDSCAYGPLMIEEHLSLIYAANSGQSLTDAIGQIQTETEICSV